MRRARRKRAKSVDGGQALGVAGGGCVVHTGLINEVRCMCVRANRMAVVPTQSEPHAEICHVTKRGLLVRTGGAFEASRETRKLSDIKISAPRQPLKLKRRQRNKCCFRHPTL